MKSLLMSKELDWGISDMKKEIADFKYQWNRQQDFNEWYDDVYTNRPDCGNHSVSMLWELFEQYEQL